MTRSTIKVAHISAVKHILNVGAFPTKNYLNANLVSKNDALVYSGHGIVHRDAI